MCFCFITVLPIPYDVKEKSAICLSCGHTLAVIFTHVSEDQCSAQGHLSCLESKCCCNAFTPGNKVCEIVSGCKLQVAVNLLLLQGKALKEGLKIIPPFFLCNWLTSLRGFSLINVVKLLLKCPVVVASVQILSARASLFIKQINPDFVACASSKLHESCCVFFSFSFV